jgi:hypothetical protein
MFGAMVQVAMTQSTHLTECEAVSGSKVLRTRKVQFNPEYINMYSYFCSNGCYNDFANKYIQQVIAIAPRREPLETPIDKLRKSTTQKQQYGNDNRLWTRQAWTETKITEKREV